MQNRCHEYEVLMSGELDGELSQAQRTVLEAHLAQCPVCRAEFAQLERMGRAVAGVRIPPPPDEVWDAFLAGVYNRLERRTGWAVFLAGVIGLTGYGLYVFATEPGSAWVKLLIATPVAGLVVLFISVLRQRLAAAKTDRYSKEVMR